MQTDIGGREGDWGVGGEPTATPLLSPFQLSVVRYSRHKDSLSGLEALLKDSGWSQNSR
jgi:hypothetical protein